MNTVLVVDDHELVRNLVTDILENEGFIVMEAASGAVAIERVHKHVHEIGCVLQDLSMPRMSGEQVIPELLKINPELPIIVYSADDEASAMSRLGALKIAGYLQKPFEIEVLVEKIRSLIDSEDHQK